MRFSPAGVPVADAELEHQSVVIEGGGERQLRFELHARAVGAAADAISASALGAEVELTGFLAPSSRRSRRLLLHVVDVQRAEVTVNDSNESGCASSDRGAA